MGSLFSKFRRKRKLSTEDDSNSPKAKRVKLNSTSGCSSSIGYGILFQQGRDSDIEIVLLKKSWKLHKSFLQQSPYFMKLLGDKSDVNKIRCSVSDPNIDVKSLELCFGFLYGGTPDFIDSSNVENVLATATFLEIGDIVARAAEYLTRNARIEDAVRFFYLGEKYGLQDVCDHIYQRLLIHLIPLFKTLVNTNPTELTRFLSKIKMDLLTRLLKDPDLVVVKDEYDLYILMKTWVAAVTSDSLDISSDSLDKSSDSLDKSSDSLDRNSDLLDKSSDSLEKSSDSDGSQQLVTENGTSFLESPRGRPFTPLFQVLDLPNLFLVSRYYDVLRRDRVIPGTWLDRGLDAAWKTHVTYYDASQTTPDVDRNITPLQRVRIIRREKCFTSDVTTPPSPYRLFRRFTSPLSQPDVAMVTLNGFVFSLAIRPDNTLEMQIKVKPDVPHILIPTLLYLRFTIFDMNSIWSDGEGCSSTSHASTVQVPPTGPIYPTQGDQAAPGGSSLPTDAVHASSGDYTVHPAGSESPDVQWRSNVFTGSDLMFLLPYPPAGLSRVLYDLPSGYYERVKNAGRKSRPVAKGASKVETSVDPSEKDGTPNFHVFITIKMVPYAELKAAKLL